MVKQIVFEHAPQLIRKSAVSSRRKYFGWSIGIALAIALAISLYLFYCWWISPEHRIAQFIGASQNGDTATMLALADKTEIEHLGLTPEKLKIVLTKVADLDNVPSYGDIQYEAINDRQRGFNRIARVQILDRNHQPIRLSNGQICIYLYVYNTDQGWKIDVSWLIYSTYFARYKHDMPAYNDICGNTGVPAEILNPGRGTWDTLKPRQ